MGHFMLQSSAFLPGKVVQIMGKSHADCCHMGCRLRTKGGGSVGHRVTKCNGKGCSLSAQTFEKGDDFFPRFELVASPLHHRSHEIGDGIGRDEIVTIEQLRLIAEDKAVESGRG